MLLQRADQPTQYASEFIESLSKLGRRFERQILALLSNQNLGFDLCKRSTGMTWKSHKVTIGIMGLAFSNVAGNRDSSTSELTGKAELFMRWKPFGSIVDHRHEFHSPPPCDQVLVTILTHRAFNYARLPLATQDSGLATHHGCNPGRCGMTKAYDFCSSSRSCRPV